MNVLFVSEIAPFPPNGGEKLRSYGLLKLLSGLDLNVTAISGNAPPDNQLAEFPNITFVPFAFEPLNLARKMQGYHWLLCRNKNLLARLNEVLEDRHIDLVFIDYFFYGQYIQYFKDRGIPVIFGTHNAQARLIFHRPVKSFRNQLGKLADFVVCRLHEWLFLRHADALIAVSDHDKKYHAGFVNPSRIHVIPNFLADSDYTVRNGPRDQYILMTANFNAYQNAVGFEWFAREVWNKDLQNAAELLIVGMGSDKVYNQLKDSCDLTRIRALGEVSDLKTYISKARVAIVPLLHGSGTRLKCLESMALKTQLVSTSKGAEGIEHQGGIVIADEAADFRRALLNILNGTTDTTEIAYRAFMAKYSLRPNQLILGKLLQKIVTANVATSR
jgi:hypothetical protein